MRVIVILKDIISDDRKIILFVFAVALIFRIGFLITIENRYYFSDSLDYEDCAKRLLAGDGFGDFNRAPLYSLWMAAVFWIAGEGNILALRLIESVVGAFLCVLLFYLGRILYSRAVGVIAFFVMAFYPMFIFLPSLQYPTLISSFFIASGVYLIALMNQRGHPYLGVLAVFCLGLSALAVAPTVAMIGSAILWILLCANFKLKQRLWYTFLMISVFLITLTPWTIRNYSYHGKFVPIRAGVERHIVYYENGAINYNAKNEVSLLDKIDSIWRNPGTFLQHFGQKFLRFWRLAPSRHLTSSDPNYNLKIHEKDKRITKENKFSRSDGIFIVSSLTFGPILLFAVAGLLLLRKNLRNGLLLILPCLTLSITYSFFYTNVRYRIPIEPLLIIFAANSFHIIMVWAKNKFVTKLPK